jgi:adenylate kinase family enzyme
MLKKDYKKIYILGTSGTGKSTLAKEISIKKNIPCFDLDDISWEIKYTKKSSNEIRKLKLMNIISNKSWIIEGVYGSWVEQAIKESDLVVWIVLPFHTLSLRLLKRYIKRKKQERESFKDLINLIKYVFGYRYLNKGETSYFGHRKLVKDSNVKYIIIRNKKDLKKLKKIIY